MLWYLAKFLFMDVNALKTVCCYLEAWSRVLDKLGLSISLLSTHGKHHLSQRCSVSIVTLHTGQIFRQKAPDTAMKKDGSRRDFPCYTSSKAKRSALGNSGPPSIIPSRTGLSIPFFSAETSHPTIRA